MTQRSTTDRLARWIRRRYVPAAAARCFDALARMDAANAYGGQNAERMQLALLLRAGGDLAHLDAVLALAQTDFRDLLVGSGLEHDDWAARVDEILDS